MDLDQLYALLKAQPRDARWLLRKVGTDYMDRVEALREQGRPVEVEMEEVEGMRRAVYRAADQGDLFAGLNTPRPKKRRRRRRTA